MDVGRIIRNVSSNYAVVIVSGGLSVFLTPLLFSSLQPTHYAVLMFAVAAAALLESFDLGFCNSLQRLVGELCARQQIAELQAIVSTVFFLLLAVGIVAPLLLWMCLPSLTSAFASVMATVEARRAILLVALSLGFQLPALVVRAWLEGLLHHSASNQVEIAVQVSRAIALVLLIWWGQGLVMIASVFSAAAGLRLALLMATAARIDPGFVPHWRTLSLSSLRSIQRFSTFNFMHDVFSRAFWESDIIIAAKLFPPQVVAMMAIAKRIPLVLLLRFPQLTVWVAYPMIAASAGTGRQEPLQRFLLVTTRNMLATILPIGTVLFVWSEVILRLWIGEAATAASPLLRLYVLLALGAALKEVPLAYLYGIGRIGFSTALIVALVVGAWVTGFAAALWWGSSAIVATYAISQVVAWLVLLQRARSSLNLPISGLVRGAGPGLLYGLLGAGIATGLAHMAPQTIAGLAGELLLSTCASLGALVLMHAGSSGSWNERLRKVLVGG